MAKKKLVIEALGARNDSGLGKLVRLILENLSELSETVEIIVILPINCKANVSSNCKTVFVNPRPMRFWMHCIFPFWIFKIKPDAVLCLGWTLPWLRPKARYGLMLADVGPLEKLDMVASSQDRANRKWLLKYPRYADVFYTISDFSKQRISHLLSVPLDSIHVIKPIQEISITIKSAINLSATQKTRNSYSTSIPKGPYFLAIGNVEPRKNFAGLIRAYAQLKASYLDAPPLYIVGHKAWGYLEAEAAAVRSGVSNSVFFTDYLADESRNQYLKNCTLFVSSSLYEGFGLPLFEALNSGIPSIYHIGSCQEEFANGIAFAVDCTDQKKLSQAMTEMWLDQTTRLKYLNAMRTKFPEILNYDFNGILTQTLKKLFD